MTSTLTLSTGPVAPSGIAVADPTILIGAFDGSLVRGDTGWRFAARRGSLALRYAPAP